MRWELSKWENGKGEGAAVINGKQHTALTANAVLCSITEESFTIRVEAINQTAITTSKNRQLPINT